MFSCSVKAYPFLQVRSVLVLLPLHPRPHSRLLLAYSHPQLSGVGKVKQIRKAAKQTVHL